MEFHGISHGFPFSLFPRECVGGFMPDNSAGDAISNTPASNVDH